MTLGETRAAARAEIGPLYSGLLHFAFTNLIALGVIAEYYQWFHLAAHLGFGRHHAAHHDPRAMIAHNFNITFPICDKLFGTCAPPPT